jgi:hypothetical protein
MQTNPPAPSPVEQGRNLTAETAVDSTVVAHLFRAALAWAVAYFAAMMTTMVLEFGSFWRDLWLGICVATFIFSFVSVILAIGAFSIGDKGRQQAD